MNQADQLRESRAKHLLQSTEAALQQFRAFRAVLPISKSISEYSTKLHAVDLVSANHSKPAAPLWLPDN